MFANFEARIVRQDSCGIKFNSIIADRVAELWYDTPRHPEISLQQALASKVEIDRHAHAAWQEMGILRDYIVRPGDRVVECGCHHGVTTIKLAAWVGQKGFVRAFDAVLFNAMIARRNFEINGITNAAAYCVAIGGKRHVVNYQDESNVVVKQGGNIGQFSTVMVMLGDVIDEPVDVLKLDVEGCELEILESSKDLVARIPRLAIEVHTDLLPRDGVARLLAVLGRRKLHVLWENGRFEPYIDQPITERVHLFSYDL
jgi:FkbM family methyltransferase